MPGIVQRLRDKLVPWALRNRQMESQYLRDFFKDRFGIDVGLYSFGCFDPWRVAKGTTIGRYCSISRTAFMINANHPTDALSSHPYLYDPAFGVVDTWRGKSVPLVIEDDVWIGHYAIIAPGCHFIGRGAVIGAGSVVTHDVQPYSIVAGVPARMIRKRFADDVIEKIEASRWWEMDKQAIEEMVIANPSFAFNPGHLN
jgi:virginiamycin A acetyltransferase